LPSRHLLKDQRLKKGVVNLYSFIGIRFNRIWGIVPRILFLKLAKNYGCYLAEYEQEGRDRAEYGDNCLRAVTKKPYRQNIGFCFEARQKRITFDNTHYRIDLVFYHRILRCHVLIDLKMALFSHADAGQMNVYLNYYKENERYEGDSLPSEQELKKIILKEQERLTR